MENPMKTNITTIIIISSLFLSINSSYASVFYKQGLHKHNLHNKSFNDQARVVKVKPIYKRVKVHHPKERCYQEKVVVRPSHQSNHNYGGIITGGIIGGVAGHQIGGGRGKDVATVAGTLIGAIIGDSVANQHRPHYRKHKKHIRYETHCDTIDTLTYRNKVTGYRVKYRYKGHNYWTKTKHHPGKYIDVNVSIRPLG